ncbi:MAG: hypothetical protein IJU03_09200 [Thermoguttaceae bacterium]|nr:hypothetical protein [Thermoguttaceae bacterium]
MILRSFAYVAVPFALAWIIGYNNPQFTLRNEPVAFAWGYSQSVDPENRDPFSIFFFCGNCVDRRAHIMPLGLQPIGVSIQDGFADWKTLQRMIEALLPRTVKLFIFSSQFDDAKLAELIATERVYCAVFTKSIARDAIGATLQAMDRSNSFQQLVIFDKSRLLTDSDVSEIESLSIESLYIKRGKGETD